MAVTLTPSETDGDGVPVQCVPGLSGGERDPHAAALPGFSSVHLQGGVTAAPSDGWTENIFAPASTRSTTARWTSVPRCSGTTIT